MFVNVFPNYYDINRADFKSGKSLILITIKSGYTRQKKSPLQALVRVIMLLIPETCPIVFLD